MSSFLLASCSLSLSTFISHFPSPLLFPPPFQFPCSTFLSHFHFSLPTSFYHTLSSPPSLLPTLPPSPPLPFPLSIPLLSLLSLNLRSRSRSPSPYRFPTRFLFKSESKKGRWKEIKGEVRERVGRALDKK